MKKIISFIGPILFLAMIFICMNSFKHVQTLNVVEAATIEEYLAEFQENHEESETTFDQGVTF